MMACFVCTSTCERCRPKMVSCPNCGKKTYLLADSCIFCKTHIPEELKEAARQAWQAKHRKTRSKEKGRSDV